jgi:hypothetical protein
MYTRRPPEPAGNATLLAIAVCPIHGTDMPTQGCSLCGRTGPRRPPEPAGNAILLAVAVSMVIALVLVGAGFIAVGLFFFLAVAV